MPFKLLHKTHDGVSLFTRLLASVDYTKIHPAVVVSEYLEARRGAANVVDGFISIDNKRVDIAELRALARLCFCDFHSQFQYCATVTGFVRRISNAFLFATNGATSNFDAYDDIYFRICGEIAVAHDLIVRYKLDASIAMSIIVEEFGPEMNDLCRHLIHDPSYAPSHLLEAMMDNEQAEKIQNAIH